MRPDAGDVAMVLVILLWVAIVAGEIALSDAAALEYYW